MSAVNLLVMLIAIAHAGTSAVDEMPAFSQFSVLAVQLDGAPSNVATPVEPQQDREQEAARQPPGEELTPAEKARRKNFVTISWIMLAGIGILGGLLLVMVLVLGASIRRRTRSPLPNAPYRNPLWYLRAERGKIESSTPDTEGE